jgi:sugar phosphate isomerase/epimerase
LCEEVQGLIEAGFDAILGRAEAARAATMARVGLSTGIYHYEFIRPSLDKTLALFARAGAQFAEFSWNIDDDHVVTPAEMAQYAESFQAHSLKCESVHGFENTRVHAVTAGEARDRYVAVQGSLVKLCAHLGGDAVVLHLPGLWWGHLGLSLREALERSTAPLDRLRPLCEELGVRLAVENYREQSSTERLDFYFSRYPADFMAFCLDTGHVNLVPGEMEAVKAYAERLCALHLHDNREMEDDHQPPFFGTFDWPGLLTWLQEIEYGRSLSFEFIYDRHLFPGSPAGFVAYGTDRIRQALSLRPQLVCGGNQRAVEQT